MYPEFFPAQHQGPELSTDTSVFSCLGWCMPLSIAGARDTGCFPPALASLSPRAPCRPTKPSYLDTHSNVDPLETKAIRLHLCRQLSTLRCIRPRSYHDVLQPQKPHTPSPFFAQSPLSTTTKLQEVKRRGAIY